MLHSITFIALVALFTLSFLAVACEAIHNETIRQNKARAIVDRPFYPPPTSAPTTAPTTAPTWEESNALKVYVLLVDELNFAGLNKGVQAYVDGKGALAMLDYAESIFGAGYVDDAIENWKLGGLLTAKALGRC